MSVATVQGIEQGDGYAVGSLDAMGEGPGFRKVRSELGVEAFGVNAIVLAPGAGARRHSHERQQELYFVHAGTMRIELGDGRSFDLGAGGLARVDAPVVRMISNPGDTEAVLLVTGGDGGYVGRDGVVVE